MSVETSQSSGIVASGNAVIKLPCKLSGVLLTPAAAAATVIVYDNLTQGGTVVASLSATANGQSVIWFPTLPVQCNTGVSVTVTGAGATAVFYYTLMG